MVYADHNDHDQHLQGDVGQIARDDVDVQLMIVLTLMMMIDLKVMLIMRIMTTVSKVMLTKLREMGREKCAQYWPSERSARYQ